MTWTAGPSKQVLTWVAGDRGRKVKAPVMDGVRGHKVKTLDSDVSNNVFLTWLPPLVELKCWIYMSVILHSIFIASDKLCVKKS